MLIYGCHRLFNVAHQVSLLLITVNPVLLAAASNTVVCCQNEDENAKVGVRL